MNIKIKKQEFIYSLCIGILTCIVVGTLFFLGIDIIENRDKNRERLEVLERFLRFQSETHATISDSINLLEGYMAYIKTNPNISEEDTNRYLEQLLSKKATLIRNIAIIKETTIIWNYPIQDNEKAIGVDLTTMPRQKDEVLKVKESLKGMFTGPIDLVQGGVGFIARLPIVIEGKYWGQISVVLDADKYLKHIDKIAKEVNLNVAIYNKEDFLLSPFYGDGEIINREGVTLEIEVFNNVWEVVIEPLDGWEEYESKILILKVLAILVSAIIGFFLYIILYTRYQLNYQAMNDQLTGLYNRHALEYYYQSVLKKAEANNKLIGIFLIDINDFKKINDNYGHKVGDLVLIEFSKRLKAIGIKEKRLFRLGGDEFLILVPGIKDLKDMENVDRIIREESTFRFNYENIDMEVFLSIGLAAYPIDGDTLERVMNIADTRMYEEKRLTKSI
ncbi:diguanylate cyclase domain-containing protein [Oceanirhabdus sp. W0125-5]|uniref:diguanylate cyclase domain-containing protein n=1 Tax=Oceanirhabdus sp. W0125-5 TaxID=2999116 RepID=UPI0022F2C44E|nr:diguanylate cyclase [Oceanirhabdus sp. W0125-5]WBW96210.1 diguanylate cyclase [Oceanirhabdus sp. W0125-5]